MPTSTVHKILGTQKPRPRWTEKNKHRLTEGYLAGEPPEAIARRTGRSANAVKIYMCRHRKKVRSDPDIQRAAFLLDMALSAGLTPGRAIQKIRTCGAFEKEERNDIQF